MLIFFVRRYKITFHMTHTYKRHHKTVSSLKKHPLIKISSICVLFILQYIFFSAPSSPRFGMGRYLLQWTLCAAALHVSLHLFRKGRSVGALEADLPPSALGGGAAEARVTGLRTLRPWNFTGGGAAFMTHVTLELLANHLSLARELCFTDWSSISRLALAYRISILC